MSWTVGPPAAWQGFFEQDTAHIIEAASSALQ
jgi:hypothetical protein